LTLTPPLNRGVEADYMIIIQLRYRPPAAVELRVSNGSDAAEADVVSGPVCVCDRPTPAVRGRRGNFR